MIPPNKKPKANVNPGIKELETKAMMQEVKMTSPKPSRAMGRLHFQKSLQEVYHAASYSKGGRKIRNIRSGLILKAGMPGMKLMSKPPMTKKMGYDMRNFCPNITSINTEKRRDRMSRISFWSITNAVIP